MHLNLGVEEEFLLVDASSGALLPRSSDILDLARKALGDSITTELNLCQIEVATDVCTTLSELRHQLGQRRTTLADAAGQWGLAPVATGTHPFSRWQDQQVDRTSERYARMEERFQLLAREQVICGCHVHVGLDDRDLRIAVMTRVRPWLPVLLALSTNSPFWQGTDTGYASYRTQVWQRWPTAGMPPALRDCRDYAATVDQLVGAGAIEDPSHLYWYVRPRSDIRRSSSGCATYVSTWTTRLPSRR